MGNTITSPLGALLLLLCGGFALCKGGRAERWGAALIFVTNVMGDAASFAGGPDFPYFINFVLDLTLPVGLLLLAVSFSSLWLGFAMLLQGVALACYAMQSTGDGLQRHQYAHWVNMLTTLMLLSVVAGTSASWRRRLRKSRDAKSNMFTSSKLA